jgi:glycosyltransferase involved in cell wall biosynthesis
VLFYNQLQERKSIITAVMSVHNEERFLPIGLQCFEEARIGELLILLDRCTDHSGEIAESFAKRVSYAVRVVNVDRTWSYGTNSVYELGFKLAKGEIVYHTAADFIYDARMFDIDWSSLDMAAFYYNEKPYFGSLLDNVQIGWDNIYRRTLLRVRGLMGKPVFDGVLGVRKSVIDSIPKPFPVAEDTAIIDYVLKNKLRYLFYFGMNNLHLRPMTHGDKFKQIRQGIVLREVNARMSTVLIHSILMGNRHIFQGFVMNGKESQFRQKSLGK